MNNNNAKLYSILEAQNKPVKTTHLQFDNFSVGNGSDAFSLAYDVSNVTSMTICGYQGSSSPDGTCYVELWVGDIDDSSSFLSPQSRGEFSNGLLYFGNVPIAANFVKLRIVNDHTSARSFTIRYYMST